MNDTPKKNQSKGAVALWVAVAVFSLGAIGSSLAAALDVHGFGRGMLLGAALACIVLGSVLLGLVIAGKRGRAGAGWLPSRDGDA